MQVSDDEAKDTAAWNMQSKTSSGLNGSVRPSSLVRRYKVAMGKISRSLDDLRSRSLALPKDADEPFKKINHVFLIAFCRGSHLGADNELDA
jgi:hypothetical protein